MSGSLGFPKRLLGWLVGMSLGLLAWVLAASATPGSIHRAPHEASFRLQMTIDRAVKPGQMVDVNVNLLPGETLDLSTLTGLTLALACDTAALLPYNVFADNLPGGYSLSLGYEWNGFSCPGDNSHPNAVLRIMATVETDAADDTSQCFWTGGRLFHLQFLSTDDSALYGAATDLEFYWQMCTDNVVSTCDSDMVLLLADRVFDSDGIDITDETNFLPSFTGPHSDCVDELEMGSATAVREIDFEGARIRFLPQDSIGLAGDINLDGVRFQQDDLVVLRDFFLCGDTVFLLDKTRQIAATDTDGDDLDSSLADLVTLRSAVIGETRLAGSPSDHPCAGFLYEYQPGVLVVSVSGNVPVGAYNIWFVAAEQEVDSVVFCEQGDLGLHGGQFDSLSSDSLRVMFLGGTALAPVIGAGGCELFAVHHAGIAPIPVIERAASCDGVNLEIRIPTTVTGDTEGDRLYPLSPQLRQNYPNPFNAGTVIEFELRRRCRWRLEVVNIVGQLVRELGGVDGPGVVAVRWDGSDRTGVRLSTGVYFYRLEALGSVSCRKMLLLR